MAAAALGAHDLGLDPARARDVAPYALAGVTPRLALRPASREEVSEALRAATRDGLRVVPWGGGVGLAHGSPPSRYDVALDLTALDRVVEHAPEDFTITAECGISLGALRAHLAAHGQELPLEAAHAARATLGGVLSADASGPRRLRFGAPHDRILGARFALGDGTLARTGGRVVKNVAGYAVHRLLCGARGGLAVILEASLKLLPAPAVRRALVWDAEPALLADAARWSALPRLEPAALTVLGPAAAAALPALAGGGAFAVVLVLEDDAPWVEQQAAAARASLGTERLQLAGAEAMALVQSLADLEESHATRLSGTSPSNTPAALAPLLALPEAAALVFHAPAGRLHVFPTTTRAIEAAHALATAGFQLIGARAADGVVPALARQPELGPLRTRLRAALDPAGTMALGDHWGALPA